MDFDYIYAMKIALVVGIDYYKHGTSLFGCVNDANSVKGILERNDDGTKNFDCNLLVSKDSTQCIS
jgi:hypothetical protein